jgi:hypothetical protein
MELVVALLWLPEELRTFPINLHYPRRRNEDIYSGMLVLVLLFEFLQSSKDKVQTTWSDIGIYREW